MNKKKILSLCLAVVMFATAIFVMPQIKETEAYSTANTNDTWNNSYHSLVDGKGDSSDPGYIGRYTYSMKQTDNEYEMTDKFAVTSFNDCEISQDYNNSNQSLCKEVSDSAMLITASRATAPTALTTLPGNVYGTSAYYAELSKNYGDAREPKNMRTQVYNYNNFDITEYRYMRVQFHRENIELDPSADPYFYIQLRNLAGEVVKEFRETTIFTNNVTYDFLLDVTDVTGVVSYVEFHCKAIRRISTDKSSTARVWYDNIRFIKNTTHTDYFAYKPVTTTFTFHDCENASGVSGVSNSSAYTIKYTDGSGSVVHGSASVKTEPVWASYGTSKWYQLAFSNSTGVVPANYDYFRFYFHLGDDVPVPSAVDVYFWTATTYSTSATVTRQDIVPANYKLDTGWYMVTVRCDDITINVKSISIVLGNLTIPRPATDNQDPGCIHFDYLHFIKYDYEPMTDYSYLSGHYQILEGFEGAPDGYSNLSLLSSAVNKHNVNTETSALHPHHGWYQVYQGDGTKVTVNSGIPYNTSTGTGMYAPQRYDTVTQGQKGVWWRPTTSNSTNSWIQYDLSDSGTVDLSKFTHYSFDMAIRNPQLSTGKYEKQPGLYLSGHNPTFRITLIDTNGKMANLEFSLQYTSGYTGFVSSDYGVEGLPLRGFIPGYGNSDHGYMYTPTGCMRILFDLGYVTKQGLSTGFDITKVKSFRLMYNAGRQDTRNTDIIVDNLVAFTPDMTINVINEGVNTDTDPEQRFVYTIVGTDAVTNHVSTEFSVAGNATETIEHLPLNGYTITQYPWAWRFANEKETVVNTQGAPLRNTTYSDTSTIVNATYSQICSHSWYRNRDIVFTQTRYHDKWLTAEDYDVQ